MIVDFGYFSMLAALMLTIYSIVACIAGVHKNSQNLIRSAQFGSLGIFGLVLIAYGVLTYTFLYNDFSVDFTRGHSSTDLPLFYKIAGVWGGMEGSLLLWEIILSFYTAVVAFRYAKTNREVLPYTLIILNIISFFVLFLLVGWSNPLAKTFPVPLEGQGMNPLLQNPGMVLHPPNLYLGYVGLSVPFAFAMGALLRGKMDNEWILTTRRWILLSWFFLTLGLIIGGGWAYLELGWGGYWAWDPVENSALMPWLTCTALLHSIQVQEKRNSLKAWNVLLVIFSFTLSILGTFITRSGVLNSVHSFAKSNIGPAFLVFIAIALLFSLGLLFYRLPMLETPAQNKSKHPVNKENAFLLNNILFVGIAFTVFYGTIFPLLAEGLADKKLSIQAPFFNTITTPMAIITILLMGLTPFLAWKKANSQIVKKNLLLPGILAFLVIPVTYFSFGSQWEMLLLAGVTYFAAHSIFIELARSYKAKRTKKLQDSDAVTHRSLSEIILKERRRWGAMIIHLGIVCLFIGFLGNFRGIEASFSFSKGESYQLGQYTLFFKDLTKLREMNRTLHAVEIDVFFEGKLVDTLRPGKAFFPTSDQPTTEVAIHKTWAEDVYVSLSSINDDNSATLAAYLNPLVNFIWVSVPFFLIGIALCLSYKPIIIKRKSKSPRDVSPQEEKKPLAPEPKPQMILTSKQSS